jgi:hypothetical protein
MLLGIIQFFDEVFSAFRLKLEYHGLNAEKPESKN